MGRRYSKLPSELFVKADTFDLMVMDVALTYEKYVNDKNKNVVDDSVFDQEELENKLKRVRGEN